MNLKNNIKFLLAIMSILSVFSCSSPAIDNDENEGVNILTIESVELTAYDFDNPDNIYDQFGVVVRQDDNYLHDPINLECWNDAESELDLSLELLCGSPEITDFDKKISVALFGYNSALDEFDALGGFSVNSPIDYFDPEAEDKTINYNNTTSSVPFSLKVRFSSAIDYSR
jgi:hypothetical protein